MLTLRIARRKSLDMIYRQCGGGQSYKSGWPDYELEMATFLTQRTFQSYINYVRFDG